jgi:hypothetical protein
LSEKPGYIGIVAWVSGTLACPNHEAAKGGFPIMKYSNQIPFVLGCSWGRSMYDKIHQENICF